MGETSTRSRVFSRAILSASKGGHDAKLVAFVVDHANFADTNALIRADKTFIDTVLRSNCSMSKV